MHCFPGATKQLTKLAPTSTTTPLQRAPSAPTPPIHTACTTWQATYGSFLLTDGSPIVLTPTLGSGRVAQIQRIPTYSFFIRIPHDASFAAAASPVIPCIFGLDTAAALSRH